MDPEYQKKLYEMLQGKQIEENLSTAMEEHPESFGQVGFHVFTLSFYFTFSFSFYFTFSFSFWKFHDTKKLLYAISYALLSSKYPYSK